jgi:hypothetical protein
VLVRQGIPGCNCRRKWRQNPPFLGVFVPEPRVTLVIGQPRKLGKPLLVILFEKCWNEWLYWLSIYWYWEVERLMSIIFPTTVRIHCYHDIWHSNDIWQVQSKKRARKWSTCGKWREGQGCGLPWLTDSRVKWESERVGAATKSRSIETKRLLHKNRKQGGETALWRLIGLLAFPAFFGGLV